MIVLVYTTQADQKLNFICKNIPIKAILFFFGCSEVNSTWVITPELANQCVRKVLFTCVVYLTNKEASTALCSVVKHAGSGRARKKCRGKHETQSSVFPHFLSALPLPKCFTTEQRAVEASLFVL